MLQIRGCQVKPGTVIKSSEAHLNGHCESPTISSLDSEQNSCIDVFVGSYTSGGVLDSIVIRVITEEEIANNTNLTLVLLKLKLRFTYFNVLSAE